MPSRKDICLFGFGRMGQHDGAQRHVAEELEKERRASAASTVRATTADHRHETGNLNTALQQAVESIPSYVERSTIMLVLVPTVKHSDRIGDVCDFRSWRGRGWCRMEFVCALMARNDLQLIVAQGGASTPAILFPGDALFLPAGEGAFTCCARNHDFGEGPNTSPCDKRKVRAVLDAMIDAKVEYLFDLGRRAEARYFAALKHHFLRGLPPDEPSSASASSSSGTGDAGLVALKARLRWRDDAEEAEETKRTGFGLVLLAAAADDAAAVREALAKLAREEERRAAANRGAARDLPALTVQKGQTALMFAMWFARWEVAEVLLDKGGADPEARTTSTGIDALMFAAFGGRADNIVAWLRRFPEWDTERKERISGNTAIILGVGFGPNSVGAVEALLAGGANPAHVGDGGSTLLVNAALNPDADAALVRRLLQIPEVAQTVNTAVVPRTLKWKAVYGIARLAVRLGSKNSALVFLAKMRQGSALHFAAYACNVAVVRVLAEEGGADKTARTTSGLTALQLANENYGGRSDTPVEMSTALR